MRQLSSHFLASRLSKKSVLCSGLVLSFFLTSSCETLSSLVGLNYKKPKVEFVTIENIVNKSFKASFDLIINVTNDNNYDITAKYLHVDVMAGAQKVVTAKKDSTIDLKKSSSTLVTIPIEIYLPVFIKELKKNRQQNKPETKFTIKSETAFDTPVGEYAYTHEKQYDLIDLIKK